MSADYHNNNIVLITIYGGVGQHKTIILKFYFGYFGF